MTLSSLLGSIILIAIVFPYFRESSPFKMVGLRPSFPIPSVAVVAIIFCGYLVFAKFYTVSSREMKRIGKLSGAT